MPIFVRNLPYTLLLHCASYLMLGITSKLRASASRSRRSSARGRAGRSRRTGRARSGGSPSYRRSPRAPAARAAAGVGIRVGITNSALREQNICSKATSLTCHDLPRIHDLHARPMSSPGCYSSVRTSLRVYLACPVYLAQSQTCA